MRGSFEMSIGSQSPYEPGRCDRRRYARERTVQSWGERVKGLTDNGFRGPKTTRMTKGTRMSPHLTFPRSLCCFSKLSSVDHEILTHSSSVLLCIKSLRCCPEARGGLLGGRRTLQTSPRSSPTTRRKNRPAFLSWPAASSTDLQKQKRNLPRKYFGS